MHDECISCEDYNQCDHQGCEKTKKIMKTSVVDIHKVKCSNCKGKGYVYTNGSFLFRGDDKCVGCPKCKGDKTIRPEFDVYAGRYVQFQEFETSKWHNPFTLKKHGEKALAMYEHRIRRLIRESPEVYDLKELVGKKIACWCVTTTEIEPLVCHVQILLKLIRERGLEDE